ncbi:MAG: sugar ABC transporter permease [Chloroflexi bacterium]|nr:MAG: sugar ABC transporter permease [Chloroflexota bacterium]HDN79253.1 sugar ABC transporter permease [Chloroflexota bacterium]
MAIGLKQVRLRRLNLEPYILLLPSMVYLALFFAWPMFQAFRLAFQTDDGHLTLSYLQRMFGDAAFIKALRTTIVLVVSIVPIQFILALTMAILVSERLRGADLFVYIYSIPLAVSDLAAGIIWFSIFTERGYLNSLLYNLGLIQKPFLFLDYRTPWPIVGIVLAEVWRATSIVFVILVAGLQSIPRDYIEAAEIFGANWFQRVWKVILPLLRPSIQTALILRTILAVQVFAVVVAVAGRGVTVLAAEAYRWYSEYRSPHMAAAYAMFILVISLASAFIYLRTLRVREEMRL